MTEQGPAVIVTRPEREALSWARALQAEGVMAETLPLIEIDALPEASVLQAAWAQVPECLAVMFVSANAVRFFTAAQPPLSRKLCRAWSTGPGTQAALFEAGWPPEHVDSPHAQAEQFDSEALWTLVADQVRAAVSRPNKEQGHSMAPKVLIVRGADAQGQLAGRDWLALQLEAAGALVLQAVAYVRRAPELNQAMQQRAHQAMTDGSCWLFSSSEAALHLLKACPGLEVGRARALATHPRIAQRLLQAGWGQVDLVPAGLGAQAVSIKSLV